MCTSLISIKTTLVKKGILVMHINLITLHVCKQEKWIKNNTWKEGVKEKKKKEPLKDLLIKNIWT
jgi:hypothetical protein